MGTNQWLVAGSLTIELGELATPSTGMNTSLQEGRATSLPSGIEHSRKSGYVMPITVPLMLARR